MLKNFKNKKGFSLIEFMTIVVIFGVISSISMFSYNEYRYNIERTNIAQDIALTIRQAQLYGISASNRGVGTEDFDNNDLTGTVSDIARDKSIRGVSLDLSGRITLFEDINRNFIYDNSDDRVIDLRNIQSSKNSFAYFVFCENSGSCITENSGSSRVDITFERPDPDAIIRDSSGTALSKVILVVARDGESSPNKYIEVSSSGSINVGTNHS